MFPHERHIGTALPLRDEFRQQRAGAGRAQTDALGEIFGFAARQAQRALCREIRRRRNEPGVPVRRHEIIMLNVALRRASAVTRELRIIPIEATVILGLRAPESANPPDAKPLPINAAGKSLQCGLRYLADIPVVVIRPLDGLNQVHLRFRARARLSAPELMRDFSSR